MFAMVPTKRAVHNKKKLKENLYIYTLKKTSSYQAHWNNEANTEMHKKQERQADLFNLISHWLFIKIFTRIKEFDRS